MVVEGPSDISAENVIRLVDVVRDCVRQALRYDGLGMPIPPESQTKQANHANRPLRKQANTPLKSG